MKNLPVEASLRRHTVNAGTEFGGTDSTSNVEAESTTQDPPNRFNERNYNGFGLGKLLELEFSEPSLPGRPKFNQHLAYFFRQFGYFRQLWNAPLVGKNLDPNRMNRLSILAMIAIGCSPILPTAVAQSSNDVTISIRYRDKQYIGKPLAWDGKEMLLLRRDGKLNILPVADESDYKTIRQGFKPFSSDAIRTQLQQEFGGGYQVSVTQHFVVVHPPGDFQVWALPFEKLYSRYRLFFSSRGLALEEPEFPMVAVVLRTRQEFDRFLTKYQSYDKQILGYYSPKSNRVITYDQRSGKTQDQNWFFQTDTIIHEATHQSAFNTGLHPRFAPVPRWISEGLAMLFEAPGVNNSALYGSQKSRINQARLRDLRDYYQRGQVDGKLDDLIRSDDLFRSDPLLAYAMAWGLTFYLSEHRPQQYREFLSQDSLRNDFVEFSSRDRLEAFGDAFGYQVQDIEDRMKKFILSLE